MRWYVWVVLGILAINGFVIVAVALFLLLDWLRGRREPSGENRERTRSRVSH